MRCCRPDPTRPNCQNTGRYVADGRITCAMCAPPKAERFLTMLDIDVNTLSDASCVALDLDTVVKVLTMVRDDAAASNEIKAEHLLVLKEQIAYLDMILGKSIQLRDLGPL